LFWLLDEGMGAREKEIKLGGSDASFLYSLCLFIFEPEEAVAVKDNESKEGGCRLILTAGYQFLGRTSQALFLASRYHRIAYVKPPPRIKDEPENLKLPLVAGMIKGSTAESIHLDISIGTGSRKTFFAVDIHPRISEQELYHLKVSTSAGKGKGSAVVNIHPGIGEQELDHLHMPR
jgi:hypothetical protein